VQLDIQCLALCLELKWQLLRSLVLLHLGDLQENLDDPKASNYYWLEALAAAETLHDTLGMADARQRLAAAAAQDQKSRLSRHQSTYHLAFE